MVRPNSVLATVTSVVSAERPQLNWIEHLTTDQMLSWQRSGDGASTVKRTPDDRDRHPAGNHAPRVTGSVDLLDVIGCATLTVGLSDLLRNADDRTDDDWVFDGRPGQRSRALV